ncbi:hypothetical protein AGMMS49579_19490 [Spirochaetia bacterium]|nr:hypothetical protein AGMMS49579_19490 [Spirochaetia bacterium]
MADFFPRRDADLVDWLKNFSKVVEENATAWTILTATATELKTKVTAYEATFEAATGENATKALVLQKNEDRDALKTYVRDLKNKHIDYNDAVTDPDRERLRLPIRDKTPSPKPRPTSRPELEVIPTNNRQHTATAINQGTGKKNKPDDAYGVKYLSEIRDTPPPDAADLRNAIFTRKTTQVYDYTEADRGKKVFYAACYENSKGEQGPWSDIIAAIIP